MQTSVLQRRAFCPQCINYARHVFSPYRASSRSHVKYFERNAVLRVRFLFVIDGGAFFFSEMRHALRLNFTTLKNQLKKPFEPRNPIFWTSEVHFRSTFVSRNRPQSSSRCPRGGSVGLEFRRTGPGKAAGANLSPIPCKTAPRGVQFWTPAPPQHPRP